MRRRRGRRRGRRTCTRRSTPTGGAGAIARGRSAGGGACRHWQPCSGGAWVNDNKLTYQHDALGRQNYEERHDWAAGAWSSRYDTTQSYDKNGNRTRYDHNVAGGYTTSYGRAANLSYTFNAVNALTAISDADETQYGAALACDANGNITQLIETFSAGGPPPVVQSTLTTDFAYDDLNRLTQHKTTRYVGGGTNKTQYTERNHQYDATGRLVKSDYTQYYAGDSPSVSALEHVYAGASHVQNYDGSSTYGEAWHWAGAANAHGSPLRSPNPDTASQKGYNIAAMGGKNTPQRRSWQNPTTAGDQREIFGQGRPMAKSSSGNGANWWVGTKSDPPISGTAVESRFFFEGTVSATDMSRATDAREANRIGIFGTSNSYGGSYGRVTNEALGRDLNPLGRGDGEAYLAGSGNLNTISPTLPSAIRSRGTGNSVNNFTLGSGALGPLNLFADFSASIRWDCFVEWAARLQWALSIDPRACDLKPYCYGKPTWDCSGQEFLEDPYGCALKMCAWRMYSGYDFPNCAYFTFDNGPCYPAGSGGICINCGHGCEGLDSAESEYAVSNQVSNVSNFKKVINWPASPFPFVGPIQQITGVQVCDEWPWLSPSGRKVIAHNICTRFAAKKSCFSSNSQKCISQFCNSWLSSPIQFECHHSNTYRCTGSVWGYHTPDNISVCGRELTSGPLTIHLCPDAFMGPFSDPQMAIERTVMHELIHICDCNLKSHKHSSRCKAKHLDPIQDSVEGYAQICENAVYGYYAKYEGYHLPRDNRNNYDWCCACRECAK